MRPALLWLRTLVLLATVMLTVGKGAWALTSVDQAELASTLETPCCVQEEASPVEDTAPEHTHHASPGGDEDRSELLIPHQPWQPAPLIGTHPAILADRNPLQPWLSLPLRPPRG